MQGLRQPQARPHPDERAESAARDEDVAPRCRSQHQLTEARRKDRHREEHHEHERHDARHSAARIQVAHRERTTVMLAAAMPCTTAPGEQRLKAAREPAEQRGRDVQRETAEQHRAPAESIRQQSPEQLARRRDPPCTRSRSTGRDSDRPPRAPARWRATRAACCRWRGPGSTASPRRARRTRQNEWNRRAAGPADGAASLKF